MPPSATRSATCSSSSGVCGCGSPVSLCTNIASGTPQARWREMHQSGRVSIMLVMRCSPQSGNPLHAADGGERVAAQARLLHAEEPLRRRAEDHRRLVAPAMRVAVADLTREWIRRPASLRRLDDLRVCVADGQALEERRAGDEAPVVPDRVVDRQAVAPAHLVVVGAVAGRRVHGAGAGIERHVLAENHRHLALVERVLEAQALERLALRLAEHAMRAVAPMRFANDSSSASATTRRSVPPSRSNSAST